MNALYTVIENGRKQYFLTRTAGGYSCPFIVFSYAERMARVLNENDPLGTIAITELFPLMKANRHFPEKIRGEQIFCPISETVFIERETEMLHDSRISLSITLDFDERKIGFVFNRNDPNLPRPIIEIRLDKRDAREAFGKENPLMDKEVFYRTELNSSILESPVFLVKLQSGSTDATVSALLPMLYQNQKSMADELQTDSLDNCEVISVTAFDSAFNTYYLNGQPFSKLNELAAELNKLRLDCGDNAFNSFVKANRTAPFNDAESALAAVTEIRKNIALQEIQGMDIRM